MIALSSVSRLLWLILIGGVATLSYAGMAYMGTSLLGLPSPVASLGAYALASLFSYAAHRSLTFRSSLPHRQTAPRFIILTIFGYSAAFLIPLLLTDHWGAPPLVAIVIVSFAVPIVNACALAWLVFRTTLLGPGGSRQTARQTARQTGGQL